MFAIFTGLIFAELTGLLNHMFAMFHDLAESPVRGADAQSLLAESTIKISKIPIVQSESQEQATNWYTSVFQIQDLFFS